MNILSDLSGLVSKYAGPVGTYVFGLAGLIGANATGNIHAGVSTAAVAALFPAGVHLVTDVLNDLRGLVADVKAVEAAAKTPAAPAAPAAS